MYRNRSQYTKTYNILLDGSIHIGYGIDSDFTCLYGLKKHRTLFKDSISYFDEIFLYSDIKYSNI